MNDDELRALLAAQAQFSAIRAQGAGGQNVNKVSSAVHLRFDIPASGLADAVKQRLLALRDQRINSVGVLVIKAQGHRSQDMNLADALQRAFELVQGALAEPTVRRATRPTRAAKRRRLQSKARHGELKLQRRRVDE